MPAVRGTGMPRLRVAEMLDFVHVVHFVHFVHTEGHGSASAQPWCTTQKNNSDYE